MTTQAEALKIAREALERAKYAIKGREHTGFIDSALAALATVSSEAQEPTSKQNARFAIDGAIQYGKWGTNKPPSDDHWLMEYWNIGRDLAKVASPAKRGACKECEACKECGQQSCNGECSGDGAMGD